LGLAVAGVRGAGGQVVGQLSVNPPGPVATRVPTVDIVVQFERHTTA
jgi:hypothetical protein